MGPEEVRQKLLPKFRELTADRVEKVSAAVLELEKGGTKELVEEIARELHTLKGEARMMGFLGLSQVVHAAEDLFTALAAASTTGPDPGPSPAGEPPAARGATTAHAGGHVKEEQRSAAQRIARSATGGIWASGTSNKGEMLDALLKACDAIPALLDQPLDGGPEATALVERLRAAAQKTPHAVPSPPPQPAAPAAPVLSPAEGPRAAAREEPAAKVGSIRVSVEVLDELAALAGDLLVDGARAEVRSQELAELLARWNRLSEHVLVVGEHLPGNGAAEQIAQIESDVHRLRSDSFRFLRQHVDAVNSAVGQMAQLAEQVGSARLIPLANIFAAFPRAARDLAREQEKEVECQVRGGETGVDRAILLSLNDPLVHLLRNAIDHGIEHPEERAAAGKPRAGRVTIAARADGDMLAITVEDDGRGADPARIREAAVRKGLMGESQAAALGREEALDLLFAPGFSTRAEVGEVSGRGVGLDVVKKKVVSLGGSVMIDSELGRRTRFTLRLPQSLSLMKALLVRIDQDVYGLMATDVEGVGRIDPGEVQEIAGVKTVRYRGRLMPVVALGRLLSLNDGPPGGRPLAAYLTSGTEGAALLVDGFHDEREVAVKAPGAFLKGMRFLSGGAALEDGRVALLLNTPELIAAARQPGRALGAPARARKRLKVLLVDDSPIARETEAAMLRALGHEVEEAGDGEEGWKKLGTASYHLLVTDVQMPVLDGIDLTRRVRASPLAPLPVAILSTLSGPEDRRRGVEAGADAYLIKGDLTQEIMASTVERLCGVGR